MPLWLVHLLTVAQKEIRQTIRDRRLVALLIIAPAIQLGVFGAAVDFDVDRVPTLVVDHDQTAASRDFVARLLADGTLVQRGATMSEAEAFRELDDGEISAVLIVAPGFGRERARRGAAHLQIVVDGTDPNRGAIAVATVSRFARADGQAVTEQTVQRGGAGAVAAPAGAGVRLLPRVLYNPRLRTAVFIVPGICALLLLVITVVITAMGLARERETGTLEQIQVTPISPPALMVGKLLPYIGIGLFDLLLALVVAVYAFGVPIRGSLTIVFAGTAVYLTTSLGVGLLISTVSRTQQQAFIGGFLFMLPALLLSGVMTPLWGIPSWMQPLTWINPVKYYVEIIRGVLLRGASLGELSLQFAVLGTTAIVVVSVASWRFQRSLG